MPNNTRTTIKAKINQTDDMLTKALAYLDVIFDLYDESGLETSDVVQIVFNCMQLSQQFDNVPPIEIYRQLVKENKIPYLGRYEQHLFHLATIYLSVNACKDSLVQFKYWETKN